MFDFGMSELLVIGVVALIVIGPKDLPELFRSLGRFTAKMRGMAREFSRAMEAAADEAGVKDVAKDLKSVTSAKSMGLDAVREATAKFEKWDPLKNAARPTATAPKAEAASDATAPAASTAHGPATQALAEAKAARHAIVKEATEKLRKADPVETPLDQAVAEPKKPRAPRKPKSDQTPKADA
ncbi:Sec-independent protein translocase protein TatB [Pseudotabrizicola algicola]|uniref:Sec-independent protein translocase protein TatB n=1 Tax=Pseudotabrizicola algicola TaxID=2709381 RepID=A0A6B3RIA6_9RHOB|nr:Sec-independent protein translocase protein TatB [Pseudotabrizicola algicola]NEX44668.1 twin-arginine translocase subunit TatB [Pseudotabrizicola algicola]